MSNRTVKKPDQMRTILEGIHKQATEVQYSAYALTNPDAERQVRKLANALACLTSVVLQALTATNRETRP